MSSKGRRAERIYKDLAKVHFLGFRYCSNRESPNAVGHSSKRQPRQNAHSIRAEREEMGAAYAAGRLRFGTWSSASRGPVRARDQAGRFPIFRIPAASEYRHQRGRVRVEAGDNLEGTEPIAPLG